MFNDRPLLKAGAQVLVEGLQNVLAKPQVKTVAAVDVPQATVEIKAQVDASPTIALVPVKSTWASKINWTAFIGLATMLATTFGLDLDPDVLKAAIAGIAAIWTLATWVIKTFFSPSVTPQSKAQVKGT